MSDEDKLQKLLRLKRYETPGDDYFERFLDEFHNRMARESRERHGMKDRVLTWVEELFPSPRLGWSAAAGGMMAVVAFGFMVTHNDPRVGSPTVASPQSGRDTLYPSTYTLSSEEMPSAPSLAEPGDHRPSPIIFPELIAPVNYTPGQSGSGDGSSINLVTPVPVLDRTQSDEAFQLRSDVYQSVPPASRIDAEPGAER